MSPPSSESFNHLVQAYGVCTAILVFKYVISLFYGASKDNHPEEDAALNLPEDSGDVKRKARQFANDLENIPLHMAVFWGTFVVQCMSNASGNGKEATMALTALIIIYTFCRIVYTLCYIFKLQPFRSIAFTVAILCVLATACLLVASAFSVSTNDVYPQMPFTRRLPRG